MLIALSLLFLLPAAASSQKFLALEKYGRIKRLRFYVNDKINVKLNNENFFRSGYINELGDTSFLLEGESILLSKVNAIRIDKDKRGSVFLRSLGVMLPLGGAFFLGITAGNSLINHSYPLVSENMCYVTGAMAATGLLLYPLTFRVYHIRHHPLKIIDVTIAPQK